MGSSGPSAIVHVDDVLGTAWWYNVQLARCAGPLRPEHVAIFDEGYRTLAARYPAGVVGLCVVVPDCPMSDAGMRQQLAEMMRRLGPVVLHVSLVLEGSGVWALMARTLVRGVNMAWRRPGGVHVHGSLPEACRAIVPLVRAAAGADVATPEVQPILRQLATRMDRIRPRGPQVLGSRP